MSWSTRTKVDAVKENLRKLPLISHQSPKEAAEYDWFMEELIRIQKDCWHEWAHVNLFRTNDRTCVKCDFVEKPKK